MAIRTIRPLFPEGGGLPEEVWSRRHVGIVALIALNAVGLAIFGSVQGYGLRHSLLEAAVIGAAAVGARLSVWPDTPAVHADPIEDRRAFGLDRLGHHLQDAMLWWNERRRLPFPTPSTTAPLRSRPRALRGWFSR